jgi:acyl carrier protein
MGEFEVKAALERWVVANARDKAITKVSLDEELIASRVVDSLRFADFVLYVEELSDQTIDLEKLDLSEFKTINAVYECFFR